MYNTLVPSSYLECQTMEEVHIASDSEELLGLLKQVRPFLSAFHSLVQVASHYCTWTYSIMYSLSSLLVPMT
jgi:hypothetical protein